MLARPESWGPNYSLPVRTIADVEPNGGYGDNCPYSSLIESLFHMPDDEAEKIKAQYLAAYPFMDAERISKW